MFFSKKSEKAKDIIKMEIEAPRGISVDREKINKLKKEKLNHLKV
jgi:sRNA-binding carbon storage regulator CsrA